MPPEVTSTRNPAGTALVREGCKRWPAMPSRTLARKLRTATPGVWPSLEAARMAVIYARGRRYKKRKLPSDRIIPSTAPRVPHNPRTAYRLPESDEKPFRPHVVTVERQTDALILSDIHLPYHSPKALRAAIDEGRRRECEILILNGDTLDFHHLSRFIKDPRLRKAKGEIELANELLDTLDELFPTALKIWKDGNHDERWSHYIMQQAAEVFDLVEKHASLKNLLKLRQRGWKYVSDKRPILLGKLHLIHGHEYPTPVLGPVNAARGLFLRAKGCALTGHHHQSSEHSEPTIDGSLITTWSTGCLCGLSPAFARYNKWNHGAAIVTLAPSGDFRVHNFRIRDGAVLN